MIAIKKALYMTVPLLTAMTSCVQANDDTSSGTFTIGLGGHYTPRYSGSDKQVWQVVPVLQGRNGAFFIDTQKGVGYDLQNASGWYFEHTLGYDLGRADKNVSWRAGANNLKGMGDIDASLNTALAVGWQALSWLSVEGKATLPLTDSQGVSYQASLTLLPVQTDHDTVAFQTAALFGDNRYLFRAEKARRAVCRVSIEWVAIVWQKRNQKRDMRLTAPEDLVRSSCHRRAFG